MAASKTEIVNADDHGALVIEQVDEVKLGEYCVLEKNEYSHRLPLREDGKSYKVLYYSFPHFQPKPNQTKQSTESSTYLGGASVSLCSYLFIFAWQRRWNFLCNQPFPYSTIAQRLITYVES